MVGSSKKKEMDRADTQARREGENHIKLHNTDTDTDTDAKEIEKGHARSKPERPAADYPACFGWRISVGDLPNAHAPALAKLQQGGGACTNWAVQVLPQRSRKRSHRVAYPDPDPDPCHRIG